MATTARTSGQITLASDLPSLQSATGKSIQVSFETIMQYYATGVDPKSALVARFFVTTRDNNSRIRHILAMPIENASADRLP